jgi:hypothetical protein
MEIEIKFEIDRIIDIGTVFTVILKQIAGGMFLMNKYNNIDVYKNDNSGFTVGTFRIKEDQ